MKAENTADAGCVYRWGKYCWEYVHGEEGGSIAAEWLDRCYPDQASAKKANGLWSFASTRLRQASPMPAQGKQQLIPTLSGYLDIQPDGHVQIIPPHPDHCVDYVIEAKLGHTPTTGSYVPTPPPSTSLFGRFLAASLPDPDIRAVVQELCGQTLLPTNYGTAGWFVGQGANGKGVLMEVVEAIHRQSCRLRLDRLSASFGLESLVGASLVLVDEVANTKFDEELFKTLVTGNGVDIDRKYDKPLRSYRSRAKWLISSNNIPHIADRSDGVWRRIVFVPWEQQIPEAQRIPDLDKKIIQSELHIVLDWLLDGAIRIVKRGRMMIDAELPDLIRQQKQTLRLEGDSVLCWIEEQGIHADPLVSTLKTDIYKSYTDWCENDQRKPLGPEMFWKGVRNKMKFTEQQVKKKRCASISLKPKSMAPTAMPMIMPITPATPPSYEQEWDENLPF
jgi:P4 family phage/plasmid primase-like protien